MAAMQAFRNEDDMLDHYVSILEKAQDDPTNLMLLSVVAQGLRLCRPFKPEAAKYKRVILNVAYGAAKGTFYVHIPISLPPYDGTSPSMTRGPVRIYKSQLGQTPVVAKDLHLGGNKQDQENAQLCLALASVLSHPNLQPSLGADITPTVLRTASALCASGNLREFISVQPQRRDEALQTQVINEIIAGLRYLHSSGVVHANLKPENVLIWCPRPSAAGSLVTLTDYGVRGASTGPGAEFRAPEVLNGAAPTEASDIFSFGQLAWMVLAWRAPEAANPSPAELKEIQKRVMDGKFQPIPPEWSAHYRRMIKNCRADARDRPTASDLVLGQVEAALEKERTLRKNAEQGLAKATEKITELESELKFAKLGKRMRAGSVPASPDKQGGAGGASAGADGNGTEVSGEAQVLRLGAQLAKMKTKLNEWRLSEQKLLEQVKHK